MKKWTYLLSGVVIGAMLATAGSALAGPIKSLVGQKETGELTVVVNGKELPDKGAVISGRTNVPVRGIVDALGAQLTLKDGVITVTSKTATNSTASDGNPFIGKSKELLMNAKKSIETEVLVSIRKNIEEAKKSLAAIQEMSKPNNPESAKLWDTGEENAKAGLALHLANEAKALATLAQIEEALLLLEK